MSSVITRISETVLAAVSVSEAIVTDKYYQIEKRKRKRKYLIVPTVICTYGFKGLNTVQEKKPFLGFSGMQIVIRS